MDDALDTAIVSLDAAKAEILKTDWKALRGRRTQECMAALAKVSQFTISKLENGYGDQIAAKTLVRILHAYRTPDDVPP